MAGRPEGDYAGEYNPEPYDPDAWHEFTPWRPGDPSPTDEQPAATAADSGYAHRGRSRDKADPPSAASRSSSSPTANDDGGRRPSRWWTEDVPTVYSGREKVRSTRDIGGIMMHVPAGTKGVVDNVEKSVLGEDRITVRFENGYSETVRASDLERRGFFD